MSSADREREPCSPLPLRNAVGKATLPLRTSTHDACPCLPCLHSRPLSPAVIGISRGHYEVLGVVRHSETLAPLVLYRPLETDVGMWVRPFEMFVAQVEVAGMMRPRFERIG